MKLTGKFILMPSTPILLLSVLAAAATQPALQRWPVDALVKVFPDATPEQAMPAQVEAARGETASLQVVVRSETTIQGLRAQVSELKRTLAAGALVPHSVRFVGYVPVDRPTQKPSKDQLRKPPADYPDPLLERDTLNVAAGKAQAVWITVPVPTNAPPGIYRGTLSLSGTVGGKPVRARQQLVVKVYPGKDGPLDSIRFEAMRDGIADYELLCLLAEKNPNAARRLAERHVLDFDRYDTDVGRFRAARRELLEQVGQIQKKRSL